LYPEAPPHWKRQFPVFGAVAGTIACLAAYEAIKYITGVGELLTSTLLHCDLATMHFQRLSLHRDPNCPHCSAAHRT
jgi:molybdopterin-synthase adenylyltransferase